MLHRGDPGYRCITYLPLGDLKHRTPGTSVIRNRKVSLTLVDAFGRTCIILLCLCANPQTNPFECGSSV